MPDRLPIYRVAPQDTSVQRIVSLGEQIFGLQDFNLGETRDAKTLIWLHKLRERLTRRTG